MVERIPLIPLYEEVKMHRKMNIKILLIDDEKLICSSLKRYLENNDDYTVDMAFNGKQALSKLDENYYDIILTDLNLPDFKEFELIDEVRNRGKKMPIIVMSAQFPDTTELNIINNNIFRCITKPFELEAISDCVTDAVRCRV
jgi:two-component system response regulator HydG